MTSMLADPETRTTMGVGFDAKGRRPADPEAWKRAIGTKPVAARLALLPEGKPRWGRLGISAIAQILIVTFVVIIPLLYPERMKTALNFDIVEIAQPLTMIPKAPPPPPPPKMREVVKPAPTPPPVVEPPKLNPKQQHIFEAPKVVVQPKIQKVDVKAPEMAPVLEAAKIDTASNAPKRPKEDVKLNNLNTGSAAPATVNAPVNKVQTGGFGDPNGLPGKGDPKKGNIVNAFGATTLPTGPGVGNGTAGANGIKGTVGSTGFGNGTANPPPGGGKRGVVQSGGFNDQTVAEAPKAKAVPTEGATTQVDILEKPKPEYTAEARALKLEGDVVLDLVFLANGTVRVTSVVSGLGHGLDEAATRAAQQIKFKPARRDGQPVDFPARVRIQFHMAY